MYLSANAAGLSTTFLVMAGFLQLFSLGDSNSVLDKNSNPVLRKVPPSAYLGPSGSGVPPVSEVFVSARCKDSLAACKHQWENQDDCHRDEFHGMNI